MKKHLHPALIAVTCLVTLFGIPVPAAAAKDACGIMTSADAEAVLGEPVGAPRSMDRPSGDGEASVCEFRSSQSKGLKAKSLSVTVHYSNSDVRGSAPEITSNLNAAGFTNVRQVSGVGDSAVWATRTMMGKPMGELTVLKGKSVMLTIISNGVPDEASALERSKALAAKLLPKT